MSQIMFSVVDQDLYITNQPTIASGDVTVDQAIFSFESDDWDGRVKRAVFFIDERELYYSALDLKGACYIPSEVLTDAGRISIGVFGVKNQTVLTSTIVRYKILPGAVTQETEGVTPELWDQILQEYQTINESVDNLAAEQQAFLTGANTLVQQVIDAFATIQAQVSDMDGGEASTTEFDVDIDGGPPNGGE